MLRRTRATKNYKEASTEDDSDDGQNNEREESDEWLPTEGRFIEGTQNVDNKTAENKKTTTVKRMTKPKEPKPKLERKPRAARVPKAIKKPTTKQETADTPADSVEVKQERLSIGVNMQFSSNSTLPGDMPDEGTSQRHNTSTVKKEEPEDSFTFEDPPQKKQKISSAACGRPIKSKLNQCIEDLQMNWDPIQVLAQKTGVELWVCANITQLFQEENTIPFMVRYRKELINHMDADSVRDVQLVLEEIRGVSKKCRTVAQTLKKEGVLTSELERLLKNCTTADEIDHLYTPYKKGSKLTKARQAKELGLEPAAQALLQAPQTLNMNSFIQPNKNGLSSQQEVATGVQEILTDMIAKDKETLSHVQYLCNQADVTIHSTVSKTALKDKEQQTNQKSKAKDISKFSLYTDFTCSVQRIQHHQTLAINRGENLKILTVKVNVPDRVKNDFCRWCINVRWRPQGFAQPDLMVILKNAAEDSFKRFIMPFLSRRIRTKLTTSAEKESIAMFVRNLRQRLLVCPVRGKIIMGIDPGFHHGCKLAVLSSTSQILQTEVVYLHGSTQQREAEKLRHILAKHSCETIVIGNGKGCRETEAFITDLIKQEFFKPLDVSYCITNEAGASIYSVSSEAVKEMPDLDPNLRSAVSIGRRVQDPLAELIKIDPKHIGIGTYQHDVSQSLLRAALDGVVQECVSFVGVDINICSETLMRHVAGLNAGRARGIMEWKEKNGPFINREQLKLVKGLGPKSFQQCAGFIRINPETVNRNSRSVNEDPVDQSKQIVVKKKTQANRTVNKINPLDQTCIHPESYTIAMRFLAEISGSLDHMGSPALRQTVETSIQSRGLEVLAKSLDTTPETLQLIVDGLTQPPSFDIRQNFEKADFKRDILSMSDLHDGMVLTGCVTNTALFGAFVDIGVGRNGLIPNRFINPNKLPVDKRRRSLALGPGDRVEVKIMNVDLQRDRISLDLIKVLR